MTTREEAEVQKLIAETAKLNTDIATGMLEQEAKRAEIRRLGEEARRLSAEADKAETDAAAARLYQEIRERDSKITDADDYYHHTLWFDQQVSAISVKDAIRTLRAWDRMDPNCDMTIVFNSPGGSVIHGMALYDEMVTLSKRGGGNHQLTTIVRGYAASMGGILLQAGDHRVCGAESYLMIHEISAGTGGKIGEIQDQVKFYEKICERVVDIFVGRSEGKTSKAAFKKGWTRQDWWLDSQDALKQGFVDEIK